MNSKKEARKKRADERLEVTAKRSPAEQLRLLDEKYGKGKGAQKERAKLAEKG